MDETDGGGARACGVHDSYDGSTHHLEHSAPTTHAFLNDHKKEIALAVACLFACLAFVGVIEFFSPVDLQNAEAWAAQAWFETPCTVKSVGIAYRGSCNTGVDVTMTQWNHFGECSHDHDEAVLTDISGSEQGLKQWEASKAGLCAARGNRDYFADIGEDPDEGERVEGFDRRSPRRHLASLLARLPLSSLQDGFRSGAVVDCHNSYLPWASVQITNASSSLYGRRRCAYEFGAVAPSVTGNWRSVLGMVEELKTTAGMEGGFRCWLLESNLCVVAFQDQKLLTNQEQEKANLLTVCSFVCVILSAVALSLVVVWHCRDTGRCPEQLLKIFRIESSERGVHTALPTADPVLEVPLSERVRHIMSVAVTRFEDATPSASGDSTLRVSMGGSHRTLQVVGPGGGRTNVPRNVAADFA